MRGHRPLICYLRYYYANDKHGENLPLQLQQQ